MHFLCFSPMAPLAQLFFFSCFCCVFFLEIAQTPPPPPPKKGPSKLSKACFVTKAYFTTIAANLAIQLPNLPLLIRVQTGLTLCSEKNSFFDIEIVLKNKSKCGLAWSVLLSTTSTHHYSFPKRVHIITLFPNIFSYCFCMLRVQKFLKGKSDMYK